MQANGIQIPMATTIKALGRAHMVLPNRQNVDPRNPQLGPTKASKTDDRKVKHVIFLLKNQSGHSTPTLW